MRILIVAPMPPQAQAPGAIPLVLHAELTGLLSRHEVELITVAGLEPGEKEAVARLVDDGVNVHAVQRVDPHGWQRWQRRWRMGSAWLSGRYPWRTIWFWEPELQHILNRTFSEETFDLVIVEDNSMGIYSYQTETPILFTEHEVRMPRLVDWRGIVRQKALNWALGEVDWSRWRRYQLSIWRRFERVQVFTQRDAARICSLAPELAARVRVNPFGIDIPSEMDPACQENGNILFIGNFTHAPNVDAALWLGREIMPILRKLSPGVRLTLVGIYPPSSVLDLECADITVTGPVENIKPLLQKAAVVVAPVRIGGGMRMKVLHSMGMGKAIVTTPRGVEGLAVNQEKLPVLVEEDAQGIARATSGLLREPDRRARLGHLAHSFVARYFSALAYAARIEAIYMEMKDEQGENLHGIEN